MCIQRTDRDEGFSSSSSISTTIGVRVEHHLFRSPPTPPSPAQLFHLILFSFLSHHYTIRDIATSSTRLFHGCQVPTDFYLLPLPIDIYPNTSGRLQPSIASPTVLFSVTASTLRIDSSTAIFSPNFHSSTTAVNWLAVLALQRPTNPL